LHRAVYRLVRKVPRGTVVTYGQVAAILGHPRAARAVGQALRLLPRNLFSVVPWQRVINASGRVSLRGDVGRPDAQRRLLEAEGIRFDRSGRVDLKRARWPGPRREWVVQLRRELPFCATGRNTEPPPHSRPAATAGELTRHTRRGAAGCR
jgi:methylated-DNA-protein-cysteine methyltransferase-like protein